jgi:hypothetical protein
MRREKIMCCFLLNRAASSRRFLSLVQAFLLFSVSGLIPAAPSLSVVKLPGQENLSHRDRSLRDAAERRFLKNHHRRIVIRYVGDFRMDPSEPVRGSLVVTAGHATITGEVEGTVLAVRGNVVLDSTSHVRGDVVSVGGRIERQPGSVVDGDMVETSADAVQNGRREWQEDERYKRSWRSDWGRWDDEHEEPFVVRYNRVEGLLLGPRLPRDYRYGKFLNFGLYGFAGYGFASKEWRYQLGGEFYFKLLDRTTIGLEAHDLTATEDEWIIPEDENSLAAFFIREDFRDYYRREGFSAYASQKFGAFKLTGAYREDDLFSLRKETNWSLFGGDKKFRDNPSIDKGRLISTAASLRLDTRNHPRRPRQGWLIDLQSEHSRPAYDSDFDFDRFIVDIRRYQPLNWGQNLDLRLRVGSSRGDLPVQYRFDLGGISTLRGYDFKSFTGNRMILGNLEYRLEAGHGRARDIWFLEPFNLIFFVDSGLAWFGDDLSAADKSFDFLTLSRLKTNIGIAITDGDGRVRLNFAKRTDVGGKGLTITFRLNRDF